MKLLAASIALAALAAFVPGLASCGGGGNATHGPSVTTDPGDDDSSGGPSCAARVSSAASTVSAAVQGADASCTSDEDCTQIVASTECATVCATVTSLAGAKAIAAAVASASAGSCSNFTADGCTEAAPPTCPTLAGAACLAGKCQAGSPSTWQSITLFDRIPSAQIISNPDAPCQANETCTSWTVTPDGKVVNDTSTADAVDAAPSTLAPGDLAAITMLFSVTPSPESALACQTAPAGTTTTYQLAVTRGGGTSYTDVTGCVLAGPALNVAAELYGIVKPY